MTSKVISIEMLSVRGFLLLAFFICGIVPISSYVWAQDYQLTCDKGRISLTADRADLKSILSDLAREANIFIRFPKALKKQITIKLSRVSIRNALSRLLKGQDYAIVYSALKKKKGDSIAEVYVLPEHWGGRKSTTSQTRTRRETNIIRNYERRLDSLRNRLTAVDRGSPAETRILRQIQSLEKTIEMMEKRLAR